MDLREGARLRVRTEEQVATGAGPLDLFRVLAGLERRPVTVAFLFSTTFSSDDALGRGLEYLAREPPVVDRPCQDQGANHASEGRERIPVTPRGIVAGHQRG